MLTSYYSARHAEHLRLGPAGEHLDDFACWLASQGYRPHSVRRLIRLTVHFAAWAASENLPSLDRHAAARYRAHIDTTHPVRSAGEDRELRRKGSQRLVEFLVETGIIEGPAHEPRRQPQLVAEYGAWMSAHRGVKSSTFELYRRVVERFLAQLGDVPARYDAKNVRMFVLSVASEKGISAAQTVVTSVRSFLRFLSATGRCGAEIVYAVPTIADWKLSSLPRYIQPLKVEQLIASCDTASPMGLRDRAILLLLARLAMRAGDVASLTSSDIDWHHGRIRVSGKSRREAWLPLPQEVGDALARYLTAARPRVETVRVFVKHVAPHDPMKPAAVSRTVHRAVERTGIETPSNGAHLLRHSAATAMLAEGATLQEIGSVLRHQSIETTAHYAKVDFKLLCTVAAPWPELPEILMPYAKVTIEDVRGFAQPWPQVRP